MMELACEHCWEEKQKKGGDVFDVYTEHDIDEKTSTAKCTKCGYAQQIEMI